MNEAAFAALLALAMILAEVVKILVQRVVSSKQGQSDQSTRITEQHDAAMLQMMGQIVSDQRDIASEMKEISSTQVRIIDRLDRQDERVSHLEDKIDRLRSASG